jgi:hypothetical protein
VTTRDHRHSGRLRFQVVQSLPEIRRQDIPLPNPANDSSGSAYFHLILKSLQNLEAITETDRGDRFANLGRSAEDSNRAASGISGFQRRSGMMKAYIECHHQDQKQRGAQQDFPNHSRAPKRMLAARTAQKRGQSFPVGVGVDRVIVKNG